jgi:anthranilate synthase component 2
MVVRRNDAVTLADVDEIDPDAIVVSPGPGTPQEAGISIPLFAERSYPTLGVCLGHQALCAANGARVGHAESVVHGKPSTVSHDGDRIFAGLPEHSFTHQSLLSAETDPFRPDSQFEFSRTYSHQYEDEERVVMAVRHDSEPHVGVQFHPESILTGEGKQLIANFLERDAAVTPDPAPDGGAD